MSATHGGGNNIDTLCLTHTQDAAASPVPTKDLEAMAARVNGPAAADEEAVSEPAQSQPTGGEGGAAAAPQPASPAPSVDMDLTGKPCRCCVT